VWIGIVATLRISIPPNTCRRRIVAVAESIRKWRGPFLITSASPRSAASAPASSASHCAAGQRLRPIVFQTVTSTSGRLPLTSRISQ
jgi:hypothetical protein